MPYEARDVQQYQDPNRGASSIAPLEWKVDADVLQDRLGWSSDLVRRVMTGSGADQSFSQDIAPPPADEPGDLCEGPDLTCEVIPDGKGGLLLDVKGSHQAVGPDTEQVTTLNTTDFCEAVTVGLPGPEAQAVAAACDDEFTVGTVVTHNADGTITTSDHITNLLADGEMTSDLADAFAVTSCPVDKLLPGESSAACVQVGDDHSQFVRLENFTAALQQSTVTHTEHPQATKDDLSKIGFNILLGGALVATFKVLTEMVKNATKRVVDTVALVPKEVAGAAAAKVEEVKENFWTRFNKLFGKTEVTIFSQKNPQG